MFFLFGTSFVGFLTKNCEKFGFINFIIIISENLTKISKFNFWEKIANFSISQFFFWSSKW
jgi:phage FluMu protein Com